MADKFDPKFGNVVALGPFTAADITTGASNQDLALAQGGVQISAPQAGSVVGISLQAAVAQPGAGSITAKAHKASTEVSGGPEPALDATNMDASYATSRPGAVRFAAGDKLGISVTSTTTLTPTNTVHVEAVLYVVFDPQ